MKKLVVSLALLLGLTFGLSAQVTVEVVMDHTQFVPNETIPVKVRMVNHSGQTIQFGSEDWLAFSVEARDGQQVIKSGEPPAPHDFDIKSSEIATTPRTDISPYFTVAQPGRYSMTASVRIKDWDRTVVSKPIFFDVVHGQIIWEQDFGVPQSATNHGEPEVRKYELQQATMSHAMKLYMRLTDANEAKVFRVMQVGPMISFSNPQTRIDQASNLHLLYQQGARIYSYTVYNPNGELIIRQTYAYTGSTPHLGVDETGRVGVVGGMRHFEDNDVPSSSPSLTNVIPPPVEH